MANENRDLNRETFWRGVLGRQRKGGRSVRAFCRREVLSEPSFYAWRREIARRDAEGRPRRSVNGRNPRRPVRRTLRPAFLAVVLGGDQSSEPAGIILELRGGRKLRLPESMPAVRLVELVRAIEASPQEAQS